MRILIDGATGVLGRALAEQIIRAEPAAELILLARHKPRLEALDDLLREAGATTAPMLVPLDYTQASAGHFAELASALIPEGLDALALLAATHSGLHPLDHLKPRDFDQSLKVGLYAPYWLLHHLLRLLKADGGGRVLGVSDDVGAQAKPFWGGYGIAKSGLDTLLEQLRQEAEGSLAVRRVVPPPVASPLRGLVYPGENPKALTPAAEVVAPWADWLLGRSDG